VSRRPPLAHLQPPSGWPRGLVRRITLAAAFTVAAAVQATGPRGFVAGQPPQAPTFSAKVEAVRVDVLVTREGRPLLGLRPGDFEIRDNGVLQQIDMATFEQVPLNLILAFDVSTSVNGQPLDHLRSAGRAVLEGLQPADRAALVTFSHVVAQRSPLTANLSALRETLDRTPARGSTSLYDGAYAGLAVGEADAGRGVMVLFSDGLDTASWLSPDAVLDAARGTDIVVYCVATRASRGQPFLKDLTDSTGGSLFPVESTTDLRAAFLGILDEFRHRYLVSYTPRGVAREGWHRLDVRVRGGKVRARPGYRAGG
jgi:VWFA-related protein